MRRITLWLLSTVSVLVLLFSYRTSLGGGTVAAPGGGSGGGGYTNSGTSTGGTAAAGGTTYTGPVVRTRWGPVQVAITVANGRITSVSVPVYPNGNREDRQINSHALPILTQETLDAQSARIDTVSGATITSNGYLESLQSALDAAHL